mmetsp:Transcript_17751/g.25054  ORF Transcript_17751/g.25054 Transcript_17751/m.25054 type:complete len:388 (-) Transcript_17751:242-1405(-)|eukprot:CAMPEP_0184870124 /NCGR_PEP_ID=MMETSP0580-20130426/36554_1 /TAXON_ID=1118495 /ORGANISM="Dactyliosolen fragilissimus" /LENGTH=387 /DNA_ID=CAMNT_0027372049 /DNA_START=56 /DNA_END=1219 /DNA_ORIENTATION=-
MTNQLVGSIFAILQVAILSSFLTTNINVNNNGGIFLTCEAFSPVSMPSKTNIASTQRKLNHRRCISLNEQKESTTDTLSANKNKLDPEVRSRLISESIAPWRTLRLFLYVSLGSGALLGGLITLSGVAAALSGVRSDLDLNTEYLNLGIDFGAVAAFAALFKYDLDKKEDLDNKVAQKLVQKKESKIIRKAMKEREKVLSKLELNVRVSDDGAMQCAPLEAVQAGGKQHVIIVAGQRKAIRDALLGANILKMEFAIRDVLIVPYDIDSTRSKREEEEKTRPDGSGFGNANASSSSKINTDKPKTWENQAYVAQVAGDGWDDYINAELQDAIQQNGESVKKDGIAIVVANTGEIIRRGVGKVPWRDMVEELEKFVKDEELLDLGFLQG